MKTSPLPIDRSTRRPRAGARRWAWSAVALGLITVLAYLPALRGGFIWDDDHFLTRNYLIRASDGLTRFWFSRQAPDYWPMTSTTLWLEWRLWGMNAWGYHASNVALHVVSVLLLWAILRRLHVPGAFLAALLFAVHPVNVESVAWITQRKNTLAMVFFLGSIWCFLRAGIAAPRTTSVETRARCPPPMVWYWLSLGAFALAMLSKASVVMLPIMLVGMVAWYRRPAMADARWAWPFFAIAAALGAVNLWFVGHTPLAPIRLEGFRERLLSAGAAIWFYFGKAVWPAGLSFAYSSWRVEPGNWRWWMPLVVALAATAVFWREARRSAKGGIWRAAWFAWSYFCLALAPALGFVRVYFMRYSLVADHYEHLALIGITGFAGSVGAIWRRGLVGPWRVAADVAIACGVLALVGLTWRRNVLFADAPSLYQSVLATNSNSWMTWNNLGVVLREKGQTSEAAADFRQALQLNPDFAEAHNNLGMDFARAGDVTDAIAEYQRAIRIEPGFAEAENNLGNALLSSGHFRESAAWYERALRSQPDLAEAENGLGDAFRRLDQVLAAVACYRRALRLDPTYAAPHTGLGNVLLAEGRFVQAIVEYRAALQLSPGDATAHNDLGVALANIGQTTQALNEYRAAIRLRPGYAEARYNAALALRALGRPANAEAELNPGR